MESWWPALFGRFDLQDLVEPGVLEDVADVAVHLREPQLPAGRHQAFLRLEQHAQPGAGDVFELRTVDHHAAALAVEESLRRARLRGIEPAGNDDGTLGARIQGEHADFNPSKLPRRGLPPSGTGCVTCE